MDTHTHMLCPHWLHRHECCCSEKLAKKYPLDLHFSTVGLFTMLIRLCLRDEGRPGEVYVYLASWMSHIRKLWGTHTHAHSHTLTVCCYNQPALKLCCHPFNHLDVPFGVSCLDLGLLQPASSNPSTINCACKNVPVLLLDIGTVNCIKYTVVYSV